MLCAFLVNGIVFGIINTFGILFLKLKSRLEAEGDPDAAFKCSLVGSLAIGSTFSISFLAGVLVDRVMILMMIMRMMLMMMIMSSWTGCKLLTFILYNSLEAKTILTQCFLLIKSNFKGWSPGDGDERGAAVHAGTGALRHLPHQHLRPLPHLRPHVRVRGLAHLHPLPHCPRWEH